MSVSLPFAGEGGAEPIGSGRGLQTYATLIRLAGAALGGGARLGRAPA